MTSHEDSETVSAEDEPGTRIAGEDRQLVDLVTAALVDPNIHTDVRMRLSLEISEILRSAGEDPSVPSGRELQRSALKAQRDQLPPLLWSVLVDPNLHTDTRMRLHREISEILRLQSLERSVGDPPGLR